MQGVITAVLAAFGAKLATVVGSLLPGVILASLAVSTVSPVSVRVLTVPSVMTTAVLFGWMLARCRSSASFGTVVAGLACFALLPLFALAGGEPVPDVLLSCAAEAIVALSFALPFASLAGVLATSTARLGYAAAVCALLPVVVWWATGNPGTGIISVAPIGSAAAPAILIPSTFVSPGAAQDGETFEAALAQAMREGRVAADPKMRALRAAVLEGADALRAAPCDPVARSRLRVAVLNLVGEMPALADRPNVELFTAAGQTRQVTGTLSASAGKAALDALRGGVVMLSDMPAWARSAPAAKGAAAAPDMASPLRCRSAL